MPLQFESAYYLTQNPDVAAAVDAGTIPSAKWHFENFGAAEGRNPNATFNTAYYLEANPDVAEAAAAGIINPFEHFLQYGAAEGRAPNATLESVAAGFDEQAYLEANTDVATAVENGVFESGYQHWVVYGQFEESRPEATFNGGVPVSSATDTSGLTEALAALATANENVETYLEDARSNEYLQENQGVEDDTATSVVDTAIGTEYTQASAALSTSLGVDNFSTRSASFQNTAIAEGVADAEESVSDYEDTISSVDGLAEAVSQYRTANDAATAATKALGEAREDTVAADAAFEARANTISTLYYSNTVGTSGDTFDQVDVLTTGDISTVAEVRAADGAGDVLLTVEDGEFVIADGQEDVAGIEALRDTLQAQLDAQVASTNAQTDLNDATTELNALDSEVTEAEFGTGIDTGVKVATELSAREKAVTDLNDQVERFENARDLNTELTNLEETRQDAEDHLTDSEEDGGLGVTLATDGTDATSGDDVYLFSEGFDGDTIDNFGEQGTDQIFFGEGYTLVQLGDDETIASRVGSTSEKEIFWQQDGDDLMLYAENETFAGNATNSDDITTVTLTGVSMDDVNFQNGFLSSVEVA